MTKIEIRQNKKRLIPMLVLFAVGLFGATCYVYFSGKFDDNNTMKIFYIMAIASFAYTFYYPIKKFFKHEPVLTLSKSEIEINEKVKPLTFLWLQVIDWKIEKEKDGNTHYLIIETADKKFKTNISWLEKRPSEIEQLLHTYKKPR
jgi:hypothetical protein